MMDPLPWLPRAVSTLSLVYCSVIIFLLWFNVLSCLASLAGELSEVKAWPDGQFFSGPWCLELPGSSTFPLFPHLGVTPSTSLPQISQPGHRLHSQPEKCEILS